MTKVITYGTYDLLHYGHIRLLKRAKQLGDYLIVGVTSDAFDRARGKINVQQTTMQRVEAVRATGLADEIIIEEYEGQKIDDINRYGVDVFTVGSDWVGKFDYLNEYCKVTYLERTEGVSSSEIRTSEHKLRIGLVGTVDILTKFQKESHYVNGVEVVGACAYDVNKIPMKLKGLSLITSDYSLLLDNVDAVYIVSHPSKHYSQIKEALAKGKHVLCESPISLSIKEYKELQELSDKNSVLLMDSLKTAYAIAYERLLLMLKGGKIGKVVSIDVTCTSIKDVDYDNETELANTWSSIYSWGPTALLPIFMLLGTNYKEKRIITKLGDAKSKFDLFTQINFVYDNAAASLKVGNGVKSEGELIISGTKGYVYVPAPWWKTDYFEIRYENPSDNERYFYALEGEGIRNEIVSFQKSIQTLTDSYNNISRNISEAMVKVVEDYENGNDVIVIS